MAQTYYGIKRFISSMDRLPASPYEGQIRRQSKPPRRRKEVKTEPEWYRVDDVYSRRLEGLQVGGLAGR